MFARAFRTAVVAAAAVSIGFAGIRADAQTPGYFLLSPLMTQALPGGVGAFSFKATGTDECTGGLPGGSQLTIRYNGVRVAQLPIAALQQGMQQSFSTTIQVKIPPPLTQNGFDALSFAITLGSAARGSGVDLDARQDDAGGVGPDFKTSPCRVTPFVP